MKIVNCENCDGFVVFDDENKVFVCEKCGALHE